MSNSSTDIDYSYDSDGLRTSKNVNEVITEYEYLGGNLVQMEQGSNKLRFTYDALGASGVIFNGTNYYYEKNAQGDILGIVDTNRNFVVNYNYDAWGTLLSTTGSMANTLGELNPLRYRGYVYDTETNFYYLQSRYYNPELGRFLNADSIVDTEQGLNYTNMFAYCGNNPVIRKDTSGRFFETVFDIITLAMSVIDVISNPTNLWSWAGLVGDLVDLIPFVTGVGETTKVVRGTNAVVEPTVDVIQNSNKIVSNPSPSIPLPNNKIHGNSIDSMKPQHGYEIYNTNTSDVVKTGISGTPLNNNGTSPRANRQVNQFNNSVGEICFEARIVNPYIPNRRMALEWERDYTQLLWDQGNSLDRHVRPNPFGR